MLPYLGDLPHCEINPPRDGEWSEFARARRLGRHPHVITGPLSVIVSTTSTRHQSNMFLFIKRTLEFGYKEATFQQVEGLLRGSIKAALTLLGRPLL